VNNSLKPSERAHISRAKFNYIRSPSYRRYVARHPCFGCGIAGYSQCAHSNQAKYGHGRGIKASDEFSFPLCADRDGRVGCHTTNDQCLDCTKEERDVIEDEYIVRMLTIAASDGWLNCRKIK
jgi:hypothetical protein